MPNDNLNDEEAQLQARLEALLFVATGSITLGQLAIALEIPTRQIEEGLKQLEQHYNLIGGHHGLRLQRSHGRVQITTAPELAPVIEKYIGLEAPSHLSRAALETLAIIAYQQPVTRPEVDSIRGVNSDAVLKTLLSKGLVEEVGRAERPGRPILFTTTSEFLQYFGLSSLDDLPPLNLNALDSENPNIIEDDLHSTFISNLKG
jgi:segregation and condensation protein B